MKKIIFSAHALEQMTERGTSRQEVEKAISVGELIPARRGRISFRYNFQFNARWGNRYYSIKQVAPIVVEEDEGYVVITVYVFYF